MQKHRSILLIFLSVILLLPILSACSRPLLSEEDIAYAGASTEAGDENPTEIERGTKTQEAVLGTESTPAQTKPPAPTPTPTPTPDPFAAFYNCEMEVKFITGPLEPRAIDFSVLGEDYFIDKEGKFDPGKGTAVYYLDQRYFILHSSFVNGNVLRPMEAEFVRRYLEAWGGTDNAYIEGNMQALQGAEAIWVCNGKLAFKTKISGAVRLSHAASQRLWLEPQALESILAEREGLISEWIGGLEKTDEPSLYIGFCGWGPSDSDERFTYFRYLIRFEII